MKNSTIKTTYNIFCKNKDSDCAKQLEVFLNKNNFVLSKDNYELAISIGGDGTILYTLHMQKNNQNLNPKILAINCGTLGFFSRFERNENTEIEKFLLNYNSDSVQTIKVAVNKVIINNKISHFFFNDLTLISYYRTIAPNVYYDGEIVTSQSVTGYVISSSFGSTAMNTSMRGPIFTFYSDVFILTPIAPLKSSYNRGFSSSLVFNNFNELDMHLEQNTNCTLSVDGYHNIKDVFAIKVCKTKKSYKIIVRNKDKFILDSIKKKIFY